MSMIGWLILAATGLAATEAPRTTTDTHGHRANVEHVAVRAAAQHGGSPTWQALGPAGGEVNAVARSTTQPTLAFAATVSDLYRSTDGGTTWTRTEVVGGQTTHDVEVAADGTVYLGTDDSIWRSTDDGLTWSKLTLGIGTIDAVLEVTIDPTNGSHLWAGISDGFGSQANNVIRSTDSGATWSSVTPPLATPISCTGITLDPTDTDRVFAVFGGAFGGGSVWFSADGGTTWTDRSAGLPNNPMQDAVHDGTRVLVGGGQLFGSQSVGLYVSSDNGATWDSLHDITWPQLVVNDIALDPTDTDTVLVATAGTGVHRSTDGGASWQLGIGGTGALALKSVRTAPTSADQLYLGTNALGVFRSTDGGTSFAPSTAGINLLNVNSLAADPQDVSKLAAAFEGQNDGGVFTSTDGGASWFLEPVPPTRYRTVRFTPDGTLYAISEGPSSIAPEGLYRRNGNGTWSGLGPDQGGLYESELEALRFSADDPDLILAGGSDFGVAGAEPTIWRSTDAGQGWAKVYEGIGLDGAFVKDVEIVEDGTDDEMLAAYYFGSPGGVLRSTDSGGNWSASDTGLPGDVEAASLCATASDPGTFYLADRAFGAGSGGLHRSTDRGQSWQSTGYTGAPLEEVVCDPADDDVLYIAQIFAPEVVLRSENQGATFSPFGDGLTDAGAVRALAVEADGTGPHLLLATTRGTFTVKLEPDLIFRDGFESGNTTGWSAMVP